jgi:hypothetical protein
MNKQPKKRNTKKEEKPLEEEYEEEYEEEEEEEEDEEEVKQEDSKQKIQKRETIHKNDIFDDLEGHPEDNEEVDEHKSLTDNQKEIKRASKVSSVKHTMSRHNTTLSDAILGGRVRMSFKERMIKWFQSKWFSMFMIFVTGWTMISEDLRQLAPKAIDPLFYTLILICIMIFICDIIMSWIFKNEYFPSTYFIIDIIVTLTVLFFDIGWIWYSMLGVKSLEYDDATGAYMAAMDDDGIREGTRVARAARIIRLIRLIRIFKMYRHGHAFITFVKDQKYETPQERIKRKIKGEEESKVGKKLSDLTTRRVLVLVILMLLFVPIFTINTYKEENTYFAYGLEIVGNYADDMTSSTFTTLYNGYLEEHKDIPMPITNVYVKGSSVMTFNDPDVNIKDYRPYEIELVKTDKGNVVGVFDFKYTVNLTAALGIVRSFFVCGVLIIGAIFFSRDATFLVIRPIEGMISKVNRIAKNPLEAAQEEENEALALERALFKQKKKNKGKGGKQKKKKDNDYETVKIEQTIIKIGALLALGFGEAGAKIIAENMGRGGDVNPMVPGNKVVAIFGF